MRAEMIALRSSSYDSGYPLNRIRDIVTENANSKGFKNATPLEDLALIHSEVSEALEDIRNGLLIHEMTYREDGKPLGVPSEIADIMIRCLHFCGKHGINIEEALWKKIEFNATRPHMHGKTI